MKATVDGKTVYIQWQANSESNLDHYNLYLGSSSKGYSVSGSPFNVGKVTSLTASDIPEGTYYAFAAPAEPGSAQAGSPRIIGNPSIVSFTYSP